MDPAPTIVRLRYRSRRALDADHTAYLSHGGMLVPVAEGTSAPPTNSRVELEILGPELRVRLPARAGATVPGQGCLVSFEAGAEAGRAELDRRLSDPAFISARDLEAGDLLPPEVEFVTADDSDSEEPTDPNLEAPDLGEDSEDPTPAEGIRGRSPAAYDERRPPPGPGQTVIRVPRPGERYPVVVLRYPTVLSFMDDAEALEATAALSLEPDEWGEGHPSPQRNEVLRLKLILPGHHLFEMWAVIESAQDALTLRIDADDSQLRKACLHPTSHQARNRREREEAREDPPGRRQVLVTYEEKPEEAEKMPLRRRLQRMGMEDKINLALSGHREERMALAQDSNKSIHHYLLKNAKLTIDEVAFMARLPSLNPDVLDKIAENPGFTQNPAVTKALVFNPRTPMRTALRLLDRLPRSELGVLSRRTGMNKRLVIAAKNKLSGSKW